MIVSEFSLKFTCLRSLYISKIGSYIFLTILPHLEITGSIILYETTEQFITCILKIEDSLQRSFLHKFIVPIIFNLVLVLGFLVFFADSRVVCIVLFHSASIVRSELTIIHVVVGFISTVIRPQSAFISVIVVGFYLAIFDTFSLIFFCIWLFGIAMMRVLQQESLHSLLLFIFLILLFLIFLQMRNYGITD